MRIALYQLDSSTVPPEAYAHRYIEWVYIPSLADALTSDTIRDSFDVLIAGISSVDSVGPNMSLHLGLQLGRLSAMVRVLAVGPACPVLRTYPCLTSALNALFPASELYELHMIEWYKDDQFKHYLPLDCRPGFSSARFSPITIRMIEDILRVHPCPPRTPLTRQEYSAVLPLIPQTKALWDAKLERFETLEGYSETTRAIELAWRKLRGECQGHASPLDRLIHMSTAQTSDRRTIVDIVDTVTPADFYALVCRTLDCSDAVARHIFEIRSQVPASALVWHEE